MRQGIKAIKIDLHKTFSIKKLRTKSEYIALYLRIINENIYMLMQININDDNITNCMCLVV